MYKRFLYLLLVLAMVLSISTSASAQVSTSPSAKSDTKSYVVVLANDPIVAYNGDIPNYQATRPGKGEKVNPNSAHVRKYEKFLEKNHNDSLASAGVSTSTKVHDYTFALNGYSALLTEDEVKAIKAQPGVVMVIEDKCATYRRIAARNSWD